MEGRERKEHKDRAGAESCKEKVGMMTIAVSGSCHNLTITLEFEMNEQNRG